MIFRWSMCLLVVVGSALIGGQTIEVVNDAGAYGQYSLLRIGFCVLFAACLYIFIVAFIVLILSLVAEDER